MDEPLSDCEIRKAESVRMGELSIDDSLCDKDESVEHHS